MTFREFLNENYNDLSTEILDALSDYMDFAEKSVLEKLAKLVNGTDLVTTTKKVYRVMMTSDVNNINLGNHKMVSTSTSKLKGKTLDAVIGDMQDRYSYHKKINSGNAKLVYVELLNVKGLDLSKIGAFVIKNKDEYEDYIVDMFKRLKSEKEFLIFNDNVKVGKVEEI